MWFLFSFIGLWLTLFALSLLETEYLDFIAIASGVVPSILYILCLFQLIPAPGGVLMFVPCMMALWILAIATHQKGKNELVPWLAGILATVTMFVIFFNLTTISPRGFFYK